MAERRRTRPRNNIYTVLLVIAFLALGFGAAYVWYEITLMTGETNPFESLGALPVLERAGELGRAVMAMAVA